MTPLTESQVAEWVIAVSRPGTHRLMIGQDYQKKCAKVAAALLPLIRAAEAVVDHLPSDPMELDNPTGDETWQVSESDLVYLRAALSKLAAKEGTDAKV